MRQGGRTCRAAADAAGCPGGGKGRKGGAAPRRTRRTRIVYHHCAITRLYHTNQYPRFCRRCHRRRFFRQSGQYHFPLGMVSRVRPTQAMWNHPMAQSWFSQPTISPYDTRLQ